MPYFQSSDNVNLYHEIKGEGKPIVLIHGWSCSHEYYKFQTTKLSKQYQTITIDLRGHGLSETPNYGLTISRFAKDVYELINHLELKNPSLLGWSMGTSIIFDYVSQFGCENIDKLCLIDMTAKIITDKDWNLGLYGDFDCQANLNTMVEINASWDNFVKSFIPAIFSKKVKPSDNLLKWAFTEAFKNSPNIMTRTWIDMSARDYRDILDKITVPTLITYGEDSVLYSKECSEYLHKKIKNSKLVNFPNCGHILFAENPDKFNFELINFLS